METKEKQWSGANYTPIFEFWVWPGKISRRQGRSIFRWSESRWQQSERHSWAAVGMSPVTPWSGPHGHRPRARVWATAAISLKYAVHFSLRGFGGKRAVSAFKGFKSNRWKEIGMLVWRVVVWHYENLEEFRIQSFYRWKSEPQNNRTRIWYPKAHIIVPMEVKFS